MFHHIFEAQPLFRAQRTRASQIIKHGGRKPLDRFWI
jgi:hypothetical protein